MKNKETDLPTPSFAGITGRLNGVVAAKGMSSAPLHRNGAVTRALTLSEIQVAAGTDSSDLTNRIFRKEMELHYVHKE